VWASVSLEDGSGVDVDFVGIVEIDFILVVHGSVPGVGKLAAAE
jgi:hypothetical protein